MREQPVTINPGLERLPSQHQAVKRVSLNPGLEAVIRGVFPHRPLNPTDPCYEPTSVPLIAFSKVSAEPDAAHRHPHIQTSNHGLALHGVMRAAGKLFLRQCATTDGDFSCPKVFLWAKSS
jgi:hypothetical protein